MAVAAITGLIPVVLAGGIVLKFTERAMPKPQQARRRTKKRKVARRKYTPGIGDFSNLGSMVR